MTIKPGAYYSFLTILYLCAFKSEAVTLTVSDNDWAPFFFAGRKGEPEGLGKELLKRCLPKNATVRFIYFPVKRMFLEFRKGSLDLLVMSRKKKREEYSVYSDVKLFSATYKPFVRSEGSYSLTGLHDFDGMKLGGLRGLSYSPEYMNYLQKRFPLNFTGFVKGSPEYNQAVELQRKRKDEFWMVGSNEVLIQGLVQQKIDSFVNTSLNVHYLAKKMKLSTKIKELNYVIKSGDYFLVAAKKSAFFAPDPDHQKKKEFLNKVDACLTRVKKENRSWIKELYRKYGSSVSSGY